MVPSEDDRGSIVGETEAPPTLSEEERALLESKNAVRQFDRLVELIRVAVAAGARFRLRPSALQELNRLAIDGMRSAPGAFRTAPIEGITGSKHQPPRWEEVAGYVDDM